MTLRLTPDLLAAGWDLLRETRTFKSRKLPPADEVGFHVVRTPILHADCCLQNGTLLIRVSESANGHLATVLAALAHEGCHAILLLANDPSWDRHGAKFKAIAKRICGELGLDPKAF